MGKVNRKPGIKLLVFFPDDVIIVPSHAEEMVVKIGVISDTHLRECDESLKARLLEPFRDVELILHAGDLVDMAVLDLFEGKEVRAVHGNSDSWTVRGLLPERRTMELKGIQLALIHDGSKALSRRESCGKVDPHVDCLVFGHTHRPMNCLRDGVLHFNPGSATGNRCTPTATVGILEIGNGIRGEIIPLRNEAE